MNPVTLNDHQTQELLRLLREGAAGTGPGPGMYITQGELIALLHTCARTLARWRASGRLPYLKMGKKLFYPVAFLLQREEPCPLTPAAAPSCRPPPDDRTEPLRIEHPLCEQCPLFLLLVE